MTLVGFKAQNHRQQTAKRGARPEVDNLETPPEVFDPLHERFGFTIDACALPHNAKLPRYYAPPDLPDTAGRCMWAQDGECGRAGCQGCEHGGAGPVGRDGLVQPWTGERVWCNPPYSDLLSWTRKAHFSPQAELIVMLVPANRCEQKWWQSYVEPYRDGQGAFGEHADLHVEFLPGRLRFIKHGHDKVEPNQRPPFGCALLIWGEAAEVDAPSERVA
jgi:hypothetical protein